MQRRDLGAILGFLNHSLQNGLEEAAVLAQGGVVVCREGALDGALRGRRDEFEASDEYALGLFGGWSNGEREDGIDEFFRDDVEQARAFLEPGIAPGFHHGVGFVLIEAFCDENAFEILSKGNEGSRQLERFQVKRA